MQIQEFGIMDGMSLQMNTLKSDLAGYDQAWEERKVCERCTDRDGREHH